MTGPGNPDMPDPMSRRPSPAAPPRFDAPTVIRTKRDGHRLTDVQIDWVIDAYTRATSPGDKM